jgi:conjugative relaxase-like TrwC/TraI family protein
VTPGSVSYYTDTVARGLDDYYAGRGEAQGAWLGAGAAAAGLEGAVSADALAALFEGRHPITGEALGAAYSVRAGADRVTGWDLTFSAPKSVSVLWAVGGGEIGMEVRDAHDAAVRAALAYLEEHAAFSRTGKAGVRQVDTEGLVGAAFVHRSSRTGDPQLHTHVLVSGRVRCVDDGVWRALDSRALHRQLKPAGMLYQAALRAELTERLGVDWSTIDHNGQAEIDGLPEGLRRLFSSRRSEIELAARQSIAELEDTLGRPLTLAERRTAYERAVLLTRDPKQAGESDDGLHDVWRKRATEAGFDPVSWMSDILDRHTEMEGPGESLDALVAEVGESLSTWRRADVVRVVARHAPLLASAEETRAWIEQTSDRVIAHPDVVRLTAPQVAPPAELRRADGQCVFDRHDAARYSTLATLHAEQALLDLLEDGRNAGRAIAQPTAVDLAVEMHGLGEDQALAVRAVTGNGDTLTCIVGPAGTGKSRAMRAAAEAWRASDIPVAGVALSAVAAGVLAEEATIPAGTVAKFLLDHTNGMQLQAGQVLIVDEAGMVATRDLARLASLIEGVNGKLVLVGDPAQLGPVGAGGLFPALTVDAVELGEVRRFEHEWERDASLRLRQRDVSVLDVYDDHGRIIETDSLGVVDEAADRWLDARLAGRSLVVVAADHATVSAINDTVRTFRITAGEVEADGVELSGQIVGLGDEVVTCQNDRRLCASDAGWVRNGDRWTVTGISGTGDLTVRHLDRPASVVLPAGYAAEHVRLGYALTTHKAQGVTVDDAVTVVNDATTASSLYVGMTRGRGSNIALAAVDTLDLDHHQPSLTGGRDVLAGALARDDIDEAATITLRRELEASDSLAVLVPRLANLDEQLRRDTPPGVTDELNRTVARRDYVQRNFQSGWLTPSGRRTRLHLKELDDKIASIQRRAEHRVQWLEDHSDLFDYHNHLAERIAERRHELAELAVETQPAHLVELLGPAPDHEGPELATWTTRAERIEAYREEWNVDPDELEKRPEDRQQLERWTLEIGSVQRGLEFDRRVAELELSRADQRFGIEL